MEIAIQNAEITMQLGPERGFKMISDAGFTAIDWCLDQIWNRADIKVGKLPKGCIFDLPLEELIKRFKPELDAMVQAGLHITQAHAPFPSYSKGHPEFTDYCIEIHKKVLRLCQYAKCPRVIIHGISRAHADDSMSDAQFFELNMKLYRELIPTALETGVMILLENLFSSFGSRYFLAGTCSDPYEAVKYIDELNALAGSECFGLCLDTGHLNLLRRKPRPYIDILGSRIKALHIHDNNMDGDNHLAPYTGNIDWNEFCEGLRAVGYSGDLSFETFNQTTLKRIEEPLVMPFLNVIYACGKLFQDKITK